MRTTQNRSSDQMEQPQIRPTLTLTLERVALGFSLLLFRIIMQPFTLRVIESAFGVDVGKQRPVHRLLYEENEWLDALDMVPLEGTKNGPGPRLDQDRERPHVGPVVVRRLYSVRCLPSSHGNLLELVGVRTPRLTWVNQERCWHTDTSSQCSSHIPGHVRESDYLTKRCWPGGHRCTSGYTTSRWLHLAKPQLLSL